ncbi:unnamed protein product [Linum trigynum]|uniref:Uncharacterized protein n=1 Tax=Linum trigynum TaxID=586398 RepID=A0AAV2DVT5_9ROSI
MGNSNIPFSIQRSTDMLGKQTMSMIFLHRVLDDIDSGRGIKTHVILLEAHIPCQCQTLCNSFEFGTGDGTDAQVADKSTHIMSHYIKSFIS